MSDPYLTVQEASDLAGCHVQTVRAAIQRGDLQAHRGGRARLLIHADVARAWASSRDGSRRPSLAEEEFARLLREAPQASAVYVIQAGRNGPLKIGRVTKVERLIARMNSLQTGSPAPLYLRRVIQSSLSDGLEQELHRRFDEHRLEGEWFAPAPEVVEFAKGFGS